MACPYFYPTRPCAPESDSRAAMLPLGDLWAGLCRAVTDSPAGAAESASRLCNLGYARGECRDFPPGDGPDAVRFVLRSDDGDSIRVGYVIERDHYPSARGAFDFPARNEPFPSEECGTLEKLARAYAGSYLRRGRSRTRPENGEK